MARLARGEVANVPFSDLLRLLETLGFELARTTGSHHVFLHPEVRERVNIQELGGDAKPYQVRQVVRIIERYDLRLEDK